MATPDPPRVEETVIASGSAGLLSRLKELYGGRELFLFLTWKNVKVQHAQTSLGASWMVLRPLFHTAALTLIFGKLARFPSEGIPYVLFALSGLLPWLFFAGATSRASSSLHANSALITRIYLPRLYLPLSQVAASLVDFVVTLAILLLISGVVYGRLPSAAIVWLPVPFVLLLLTTIGTGLWLAALTIRFPDMKQVIGNVLQLMMFATPVIWPLSLLSERLGMGSQWLNWYALYPMAGVVESFRVVLFGQGELPWHLLGPGLATSTILLVSGLWYFQRHESEFADLV
jgi:lipopolysaccharide transport system permease protein